MGDPLMDLRLPDVVPAGAAVQALAAILTGLRIDEGVGRRIGALVVELIEEARTRDAFDEATSPVRLTIEVVGNNVVVSVRDQRAPDRVERVEQRSISLRDMLGAGGEFSQRTDVDGNRASITVPLPRVTEDDLARPAARAAALVDAATAERVLVRPATPADAEGIRGLAFRVFGFHHIDESLYTHDILRQRLESGSLLSTVAVGPDGTVVGHAALVADDVLPEWGRIMVDPRWRGRSLAVPLGAAAVDSARQRGWLFAWSECTTDHPLAQRVCLGVGGVEVGLLVGTVPAGMTFTGESARTSRGSLMPYAIPVMPGGSRTAYVPAHHGSTYREIAKRLGIERTVVDPGAVVWDGVTSLEVGVNAGDNTGRITVRRLGVDAAVRVAEEYLTLVATGLAAVYLDIGLHDPSAAEAIRVAESNGFFWAALLPEARDQGDVLRMQRVGWVQVDTESSQYASEFGRVMAAHVLAERARVQAPVPGRSSASTAPGR